MSQLIYRFGSDQVDGDGSMKELLGGKGAGLAEMSKLGIPVPAGFTITTEQCVAYMACQFPTERDELVDALMVQVMPEMARLNKLFGYMPLVSVRSGARVSMPGMMDTILNVGIGQAGVQEWTARLNSRAARDSYRRLIQMMGSTAYGVPHEKFEELLTAAKKAAKVKADSELNAVQLENLIGQYEKLFQAVTQKEFPQNLEDQLRAAIEAVFKSWNNERAKEYRKLNKIPDEWGTAVTVQAMVFGNMNDQSCSGVAFTRDPKTGANVLMGEFLPNAQGEDVVAGIRTPVSISKMVDTFSKNTFKELHVIANQLEAHYCDMMDLEFTVQDGTLYMLQCRTGKRQAAAAFKIACDLVEEKRITKGVALKRLTADQYLVMMRPSIDPSFKDEAKWTGIGASVGIVTGTAVGTAEEAKAAKGPVILVREETDPDDIGGMAAALGVLTRTGGQTSHAAVVCSGMDKPCVVGCTDLAMKQVLGKQITIDGATGRVWLGEVPIVAGGSNPYVDMIVGWLFGETGVLPVSDKPLAKACVIRTAAWQFWDAAAVLSVLEGGPLCEAKDVVIDVTPVHDLRDKGDDLLWEAFAMDRIGMKISMDAILKAMVTYSEKWQGATVVGSLPTTVMKPLVKAGYKTAGNAATMADLLEENTRMQVTDEFVEKVLGGKHVLEKLVSMGLKLAAPLPQGVDRHELVFQRLGQ